MPIGAEAYIYKPSSQQEAIRKGRRVKHIDHYIGPGRIVRHIGTRSIVVVIKDDHDVDREYQRDAGKVLLKKPRPDDADQEIMREQSIGTRLCSKDDLNLHAFKGVEIIILKDEPEAKDWYCAEVRAVLADRIEVNYFTTQEPTLDDYDKCSIQKRKARLREALFLRTWCLLVSGGKGESTTNPPSTKHPRTNHLWWGKIPMEDVTNHILVRDVGLDATGKLDKNTINLASNLKYHIIKVLVARMTSPQKKRSNVKQKPIFDKRRDNQSSIKPNFGTVTLLQLYDVNLEGTNRALSDSSSYSCSIARRSTPGKRF